MNGCSGLTDYELADGPYYVLFVYSDMDEAVYDMHIQFLFVDGAGLVNAATETEPPTLAEEPKESSDYGNSTTPTPAPDGTGDEEQGPCSSCISYYPNDGLGEPKEDWGDMRSLTNHACDQSGDVSECCKTATAASASARSAQGICAVYWFDHEFLYPCGDCVDITATTVAPTVAPNTTPPPSAAPPGGDGEPSSDEEDLAIRCSLSALLGLLNTLVWIAAIAVF
jgi:hypothetical protein